MYGRNYPDVPDVDPLAVAIHGATLLDDVARFLGRFVSYPNEHAHRAHVLWVAHTWFMDCWESTPRIAFLSPEPGSGQSRALEVTEPLAPRPVHAVNVTPAYLFRKVSDPDGSPTILYDEIDTVFGPRAKDNEDVRGILNAGHRKGATAGRCVVRGKNVETEDLPAYCAVALAGLNDLPDTIMTRAVVIRMRRRGPGEQIEPWRRRVYAEEATELRDQLAAWAEQAAADITWPGMPAGVEDRNADVWEALLAVADLAGGDWPKVARVAAVTLVTDSMGDRESLGVRLLRDLRAIFNGSDVMTTETILTKLNTLEEAPWGDLRGRPLDARGLAHRLRQYGVKSTTVRLSDAVAKGYRAEDLHDPWSRYVTDGEEALWKLGDDESGSQQGNLSLSLQGAVTSVTAVTGRQAHAPSDIPGADPAALDLDDLGGKCPECQRFICVCAS